jgi:hypothetical protein
MQVLFAAAVTIALGAYLLASAFAKTLKYGYTNARMTPAATQFSRIVRLVLGLCFIALGIRFVLQMFG